MRLSTAINGISVRFGYFLIESSGIISSTVTMVFIDAMAISGHVHRGPNILQLPNLSAA